MVDVTDPDEFAERAWHDEYLHTKEDNPLFFHNIEPKKIGKNGYFFTTFANVSAFLTNDGWVLVDCCFHGVGEKVYTQLQEIAQCPIIYVIATHFHLDHVGGLEEMEKINIELYNKKIILIGHENGKARLDRYCECSSYNQILNSRQFQTEYHMPFSDVRDPDITYTDKYELNVGGVKFQCIHDKGETDDATWVYVPTYDVICAGDFLIWNCPNAGNPQKVQRYPREWSVALRKMQLLKPKYLFPGHGPFIQGVRRCYTVLDDTASLLENVYRQTISLINQGLPLYQVKKKVIYPKDLLAKPYLHEHYDCCEFIVSNIWRQKCGWWGGELWNLKNFDTEKFSKFLTTEFTNEAKLIEWVNILHKRGDDDIALFLTEMLKYNNQLSPKVIETCEMIYQHQTNFDINQPSMIRNQFNYALRKLIELFKSRL